jgi:hypothetical protein
MHHATPCQRGAVIRREVIISETADLSFPKTLRVIPFRDYGPRANCQRFDGLRVIRSEAFLAFLDSNDIYCTYSYSRYRFSVVYRFFFRSEEIQQQQQPPFLSPNSIRVPFYLSVYGLSILKSLFGCAACQVSTDKSSSAISSSPLTFRR